MNAFEQVASPGQSLREVKTILRYKCQSNLFHSQQAVPRPKQMANKFSPGPDNSKEQDQGQTAEQHADVAFFADDPSGNSQGQDRRQNGTKSGPNKPLGDRSTLRAHACVGTAVVVALAEEVTKGELFLVIYDDGGIGI